MEDMKGGEELTGMERAEEKEEKRRIKKQVTARVPQGSVLGPVLVIFSITTLAYEVGVLLKSEDEGKKTIIYEYLSDSDR